jgi:hypothetical protein
VFACQLRRIHEYHLCLTDGQIYIGGRYISNKEILVPDYSVVKICCKFISQWSPLYWPYYLGKSLPSKLLAVLSHVCLASPLSPSMTSCSPVHKATTIHHLAIMETIAKKHSPKKELNFIAIVIHAPKIKRTTMKCTMKPKPKRWAQLSLMRISKSYKIKKLNQPNLKLTVKILRNLYSFIKKCLITSITFWTSKALNKSTTLQLCNSTTLSLKQNQKYTLLIMRLTFMKRLSVTHLKPITPTLVTYMNACLDGRFYAESSPSGNLHQRRATNAYQCT